ncbi:AmmeMemoRadiSam system protein A [Patescibacteria group bacterium]
MNLSKKDKQFLLKLSRSALEHIFKTNEELVPNDSDIPEKFKVKAATFVTLTIDSKLRGCIGKLIPQKQLYIDIVENTYNAAFSDPRFPQLTKDESDKVKIEISILDKPKKLEYENTSKLLKKLSKGKPGVIIQHGLYSATFLPQVWDDIKTPEQFLSQLCQKAGLEKEAWKDQNLEIQTYKVTKFSEN